MLGKKILASIFAVVILLKLIALATGPAKWLGLTGVFLGHYTILMVIYLVLLVITGYYVLTRLDLLDVAVVMFFTSLLVGLSLIPYAAALLKLQEDIITVGLGKVWSVVAIWGLIALGVLYRVFARKR
jgi:hypothetical protein